MIFDYLEEHYPNQNTVIFFHSYFFVCFENLKAALQHELGHLTQFDWQNKKINNKDIYRHMEIDADIKAMCLQDANGKWSLSTNYEKTIENLYEAVQDNWREKLVHSLCVGLNNDVRKRIYYEFTRLCTIHFNSCHPLAPARKKIMQRVAKKLKEIGNLNNNEMGALTLLITTRYYQALGRELSEEFLTRAQEAEGILLSNSKLKFLLL